MTISLEDIVNLQHNTLNTLSRKLIYLMVRNGANAEGWATISSMDFCKATALPRSSVESIVKHLVKNSLIERRKSGASHSSPYQYRVIPY